MKNHFAEDYKIYEELKRRYGAAKTEEEKETVRREHTAWQTEMEETETEEYTMLYHLYSEARERGNEYIDFCEPHQYSDPKRLVSAMRTHGVEAFSFSSTWSSAVETAWAFLQAGCTMEGMVKINTPYKAFGTDDYEKKPAYLFKL